MNWLRPFTAGIDLYQVADYLPNMRAYEAKDPTMWPAYATLNPAQQQAFTTNVQRYINAATPADAIDIWLETEGAAATAAGAQTARNEQVAARLGLR